MRKITEIYVHCSATPREWAADKSVAWKRDEIDRWHRRRGFRMFGYHYLIDRDGSMVPGRAEADIGAHVLGHNTNSIGVCIVGGHSSAATDKFAEHFTVQQDVQLRRILKALKERYPDAKIRGHNEVAAKACPGFTVSEWLAEADDDLGAKPRKPSPFITALIAWLKRKAR